jgi:hypothetical protein
MTAHGRPTDVWGWRRIGLVVLVAPHQAACAVAVYFIGDEANSAAVMPLLWPAMFVLGTILVLALAIWPWSHLMLRLAGAAAVTAVATWPLNVFGNYLVGFTRSGWSVVLAALVCLPFAWLSLWWWFAKVGPWQVRHEVGATVDGD